MERNACSSVACSRSLAATHSAIGMDVPLSLLLCDDALAI